jgi:hypothetical protein
MLKSYYMALSGIDKQIEVVARLRDAADDV